MSQQSDFVSKYRQLVGDLLQTRGKLEMLGKLLTTGNGAYLDAGDAFQGANNDLSKAEIVQAKTILEALNDAITTEHQMLLVKVAGTAGFPKG